MIASLPSPEIGTGLSYESQLGLPSHVVTFKEIDYIFKEVSKRGNGFMWHRAYILRDAEPLLDENEFLQLCANHGVAYTTAQNLKRTANEFTPDRIRWSMDFTAHQAVQGLPRELQDELLEIGAEQQWGDPDYRMAKVLFKKSAKGIQAFEIAEEVATAKYLLIDASLSEKVTACNSEYVEALRKLKVGAVVPPVLQAFGVLLDEFVKVGVEL